MKNNQRTYRIATTILHGLLFVLLAGMALAFILDAGNTVKLWLVIITLTVSLIEIFTMNKAFRLGKAMESDLYRSQVELLEQQLQNNEDRLNALQSQINPHFLYNTLETIREMALEDGEVHLSKIISSLSLMFRYSMDFSNAVVPVEHELGQVERYMKLQQLRFPDRYQLNIVRNCDAEDLRHIMIPKFSIQPLVENAIRHAFKNMSSGCVLTIRFTASESSFEISVEDNGKGMEEEDVEQLNHTILYGQSEKNQDSPHNGIGMHNIYSRLKLYFGEQVSMYVNSSREVGTIITISLPMNRNE